MGRTEMAPTEGTDQNKTAEQLLIDVNKEIAAFEAKKLSELKSELTNFVSSQKQLKDDYAAGYDALRRKWDEQKKTIEDLYKQIVCVFPDGKANQAAIDACICKHSRKDVK